MKTIGKLLMILPLFTFLFISCSEDDPEVKADCGPDYCISDLAGNWNATQLTFTYCGSEMIEPTSYDLILQEGSATMLIQANGRFTLTVVFPGGEGTEVITGKIYFEDKKFFAIQFDDDPPNDPTYFGDTLSGNTFALVGGPETAEFDFDDDGTEECASVSLTFERD